MDRPVAQAPPLLPQRHAALLRGLSRMLGAAAMLSGLMALARWPWDAELLEAYGTGVPLEVPATAIGFVCAGLALLLGGARGGRPWVDRTARTAAAGAIAIGMVAALALFALRVGGNAGALLAGAMAVAGAGLVLLPSLPTALTLAVAGMCLLALSWRFGRWRLPDEWLALLIFASPLLALIGHTFGMSGLFQVPASAGMSPYTALTMLAIGTGILLS